MQPSPSTSPRPPRNLGAVDRAFRAVAAGPLPMGIMLDFEGPAPTLSSLRARVAERVADIASLHYQVDGDERELRAVTALAVDEHVHRLDLTREEYESPDDADRAADRRMISTPLTSSRPPWDLWLIPRARGHSLCFRSDHALRDGAAAVCITRALLDDRPGWRPRTHPAVTPGLRGFTSVTGQALRALRSPEVPPAFAGASAGTQSMFHADAALDRLHAARRLHGGTVNDVYLAALSQAVRRWHVERTGRTHPPMPISMPLSVRAPGQELAVGNALVTARVTLPCAHGDSHGALRHVISQTGPLRRSHHRHAARVLLRSLPPAVGMRAALRLADAEAVPALASTMEAGPELTHQGLRATRAAMFIALAGGLRCYTALTTYQDNARLTVVHDDALTGIDCLGDHWRTALDELVTTRPSP
ncbi:wax ester/triacylglycerol synthase domain-containing protein [Streptomyces sp. NPDC089424]|uniref:wax ester/triacylglycerol synthase domain-containing protein n=1 Tax=Streptomyces sp. NPDC089424 TaxID=3365917 RepID=UPI00381BACE7